MSEAFLYTAPSCLRFSASLTTMKTHPCALLPEGARMAASRTLVITSSGTGSGLIRLTDRAEYIASNSPNSAIFNIPRMLRVAPPYAPCRKSLVNYSCSLYRLCLGARVSASEQFCHDLLRVGRILDHRARLHAMFHQLIVIIEFAHAYAIFQQEAVRVIEVDRTAPFVIDHRSDVDALVSEVFALGLEFLQRIHVEGEMIERGREVLSTADVGCEFRGNSRHLLGAHKSDQRAVARIQEGMLDPAALRRFENVAPCDLPAEDVGVEVDCAIDIERRKSQVMHAAAFHWTVLRLWQICPLSFSTTAMAKTRLSCALRVAQAFSRASRSCVLSRSAPFPRS